MGIHCPSENIFLFFFSYRNDLTISPEANMSRVLNETASKCSSNYLKINILKVSGAVTVHKTAMQGILCMSTQIQRNTTCSG